MFGIETDSSVSAHADGEALVKPTIVAIAMQQLLAKRVQQLGTLQIELEGFVIKGKNECCRLDGAQRDMIDATREIIVACLGPLGTVPGGQRSQMLLALYRRGLGVENLFDLTVKKRIKIKDLLQIANQDNLVLTFAARMGVRCVPCGR